MAWGKGTKLRDGEYIIEKVLGRGGFGITYKARHVMLDEWVVIKTPNQDRQDDPEYPKFVKRFLKEARVLAKLGKVRHPHIVRVSNLFLVKIRGSNQEIIELPCLVMDFIEGRSLYRIVREDGALPEAVAVGYIKQICSALAVVHEFGLVHRDAHPGNIMIPNDEQEQAILIDFGLVGEVISSTASSEHFGNRAFAPYEQHIGSKEPTVDLYTLAASLYYAVTDQLPTMSLARQLKQYDLIPPKQHNPNISEELNQVILWGLELEAENRPQSTRLWLQRLESILISQFREFGHSEPLPTESSPKLVSPPVAPPHVKKIVIEKRKPKDQERIISPPPKYPQLSVNRQPLQKTERQERRILSNRLIRVVVTYIVLFFSFVLCLSLASGVTVNEAEVVSVEIVSVIVAFGIAGSLAWAGTEALAWLVSLVIAGTMLIAIAMAMVGAMTGEWGWAGAMTWTVVGVVLISVIVAGAAAVDWAADELHKYFSKFHVFLIIGGTSGLGIILGWLLYQIFPALG